jgi:hypothetical protein
MTQITAPSLRFGRRHLALEWCRQFPKPQSHVPYFKVLVNGRGLRLLGVEGEAEIRGFFTTRVVRASSSNEATEKAVEAVREKWRTESFAEANRGQVPVLQAEEVHSSSFLESLRIPGKGYTFYTAEDTDA